MNPWVILGLLVAWIASLAGIGYWQNDAGHVAERTTWQTRENNELRAANGKIKDLEEGARKTEQVKAAALATISTDYERKLSDANKQRAVDVAAVRAGNLRLRDQNTPGLRACGSVAPETAAGAGGRDGQASGELSGAASEFLLDLVNDADAIVEQLSSCQAIVVVDRTVGVP